MTAARGTTGVSCLMGRSECGVAQRDKGMSGDGAPVPSSHPDRVGKVSDATTIPATRTIPPASEGSLDDARRHSNHGGGPRWI